MVDLDPDLRWCPEPKCNGYVRKNKKLKSREVTCETCKAKVCFDCGEKAHKGECGMSQKDEEFEQWCKENGAVKCPKCTITVYKYEGCNHMTC